MTSVARSRFDALLDRVHAAGDDGPPVDAAAVRYDPRALRGPLPWDELPRVPSALRVPRPLVAALIVAAPFSFLVGVAQDAGLLGAARGLFYAATTAFLVASTADLLEHARLQRAVVGGRVVPLGESLLHAALVLVLVVLLRAGATHDVVVVVGPLAFLALLAIDELVYHRRRVQQREHAIHVVGTLAAAATLATFVALRFVAD